MKYVLSAFLSAVLMINASAAMAADNASSTAGQALSSMASLGYPLTVNSNVGDSASVEAVLIPYNIAKHVFGKETAQNYIVIELIVTDHNPQASLIIESVFLDYSQWVLANFSGGAHATSTQTGSTDANGTGAGNQTGNSGATTNSILCANGVPVTPSDAAPSQRLTCPYQIGSAEYRMVRAEMQDMQPYTLRNLLINGATALGSVATAFVFPFSSDIIKGVNAWNGGFVPAVAAMFPDGTINQLNHISDLGFQTNKVIPKQSSDIVVAFFPISRLLTKTLASIYRDDPAAFFVPYQIAFEPKHAKQLLKLINIYDPKFSTTSLSAVLLAQCNGPVPKTPQDPTVPKDTVQNCQDKYFIQSVALTNVQIGIGGDMTVSTQQVPPTITAVNLTDQSGAAITANSKFWSTVSSPASPANGKIIGTYLTGGTPQVVDSQGNPISEIAIQVSTQGATDSSLPFQLTISKCLAPTPIEIFFKVTKQTSATAPSTAATSGAQSTSQVSSMLYDFGKVDPSGCTNPTITAVSLKDKGGAAITADSKFWSTFPSTAATGSITGTSLTGGVPQAVDSKGSPISEIAIQVTQGATDSSLPIQLTLSKCLTPIPIEIYFKVTKQASAPAPSTTASSGAENTSQASGGLYDFGKVDYPSGCNNPPS